MYQLNFVAKELGRKMGQTFNTLEHGGHIEVPLRLTALERRIVQAISYQPAWPKTIATRLGRRQADSYLRACLRRLTRLGVLGRGAKGFWVRQAVRNAD